MQGHHEPTSPFLLLLIGVFDAFVFVYAFAFALPWLFWSIFGSMLVFGFLCWKIGVNTHKREPILCALFGVTFSVFGLALVPFLPSDEGSR